MRGWAISPDAMALVDLQEHEAPTVIEFGSGQSTIILASALSHRGGKLIIISVEHDVDYSGVIRKQLDVCGLADVVLSLNLPIEDSTDPQEVGIRSYDHRALPSQKVDIALIDGLPKMVGNVDAPIWSCYVDASKISRSGDRSSSTTATGLRSRNVWQH